MKNLAPVAIFAFNRPSAFQVLIDSLKENAESKDIDLYIFIDGPREGNSHDHEMNLKIREIVSSLVGFSHIEYFFSENNKGLAASIISGVSLLLQKYENIIVLEDDLILSSNFLCFMNSGLNKYQDNKDIFSICGYTNKVKIPVDYSYDSYFCTRSSSWGWATWTDRWITVDWELLDWSKCLENRKSFNKWGGSDCFKMLKDWKFGKNSSWAIRFCYAQFIQKKKSLFPTISKVRNNGFNGDGTNCKKYSRFKSSFDKSGNKSFIFPDNGTINHTIFQSFMKYNSIKIRIWSRLMYLIKS